MPEIDAKLDKFMSDNYPNHPEDGPKRLKVQFKLLRRGLIVWAEFVNWALGVGVSQELIDGELKQINDEQDAMLAAS